MTQKAVDRLEVVQQVVQQAVTAAGGGPPAGPERAADQAPDGPIPGRRPLGTGPHPLSRLRPHAGLREAVRPPRAQALFRDAAPVDDRRGAMKAQGTQVSSHSSAAPTSPVSGRAGADRRLTS